MFLGLISILIILISIDLIGVYPLGYMLAFIEYLLTLPVITIVIVALVFLGACHLIGFAFKKLLK